MMTNREKNKERFDELEIGDWSDFELACRIAVRKNGDVDLCDQIPCHDCIFGYGNCIEEAKKWLTDEAEPDKTAPEEKEKIEKDEIKVGDTVKVTRKDHIREGEIGTVKMIRHIRIGLNKYEVSFDGNCYGNFFSKYEIEKVEPKEEEKMEKDKIRVGDTVKVTKKSCAEEGKIGLVIELFSISADGVKTYRVRFNGTFSECVFFENELEKVKSKKTPPSIVVYRDGDTVTVKDLETGEEASAVCSKDDTFDLHTGAFIAMSRLTHFDTGIRLMRLEWEQIESYVSDIKMRFGALMGKGYKYPDFDEEEKAK